MLCPSCFGTHYIATQPTPVPCPECHGAGSLHCCDGMQCQVDENIEACDEETPVQDSDPVCEALHPSTATF